MGFLSGIRREFKNLYTSVKRSLGYETTDYSPDNTLNDELLIDEEINKPDEFITDNLYDEDDKDLDYENIDYTDDTDYSFIGSLVDSFYDLIPSSHKKIETGEIEVESINDNYDTWLIEQGGLDFGIWTDYSDLFNQGDTP